MTYAHNGITIRTELQPGDMGFVIYLHGSLYKQEYGYGRSFETYVAQGFCEFQHQYNPAKDCVWVCEAKNAIVGFMLLMHRPGDAAQLRFFLVRPEYRGRGLGKKLMELFLDWLHTHGYRSAYLWTTNEQQEAAALYKQFGFAVTDEESSTHFGKPVLEQRYERMLTPS